MTKLDLSSPMQHKLIQGLIERLPPLGSHMTMNDIDAWRVLAGCILRSVYCAGPCPVPIVRSIDEDDEEEPARTGPPTP